MWMNLHAVPPTNRYRESRAYPSTIATTVSERPFVGHHGSHFGFTHEFGFDEGLTLHLPEWRPLLNDFDLKPQPIARHDRFSKFRSIDTGQIDHRTSSPAPST